MNDAFAQAPLTLAAPPLALPADSARLQHLVQQHFDFVWRCLLRSGTPEADVDDVIQRVFLTAARRLADIRPGAERSFLFALASSEAGHLRRTHRRRGEVAEEAIMDKSTGALRPDELVDRRQALVRVRALLEQLADELREVFLLCEVEELSSGEVAEALGIPVGTVKSRLRRAREQFSALIQNAGERGSRP